MDKESLSKPRSPENVRLTRREFLSTSLAIAGGLAANSILPGSAVFPDTEITDDYDPGIRSNVSNLISLPKSGGSLAGLGETFEPNLLRGSEGISVPLFLSPGRNDFGPRLTLRYSIDNGNGPFGLGWKLDLPQIHRKTQTRLPRYNENDRFVLSGSEDIVPDFTKSPFSQSGYKVTQYRRRFEGPFSRIERWDRLGATLNSGLPSTFWRITDKANITGVFGATSLATLGKPGTDAIFLWSLELVFDGKGNFVYYQYKSEDGGGSGIYLKQVRYGNLRPKLLDEPTEVLSFLSKEVHRERCFFEAIFDYGEHGETDNGDHVVNRNIYDETHRWDSRRDEFSTYRQGFEISTKRLCKRVLMFHHVPGEEFPLLVGSTDFSYKTLTHNQMSTLCRAIRRGYMLSNNHDQKYSEDYVAGKGQGVRSSDFDIASIPPLDFEYTEYQSPNPETDLTTLKLWKNEGYELDRGIHDESYTLIDLFGRGLPDILKTSNGGYFYWKNQGAGQFAGKRELANAPRRASGSGSYVTFADKGVGFGDISGDGSPDILVVESDRRLGYCEQKWSIINTSNVVGWAHFREFENHFLPEGFSLRDRSLRLLDLTGDGHLAALKIRPTQFTVYECQGREGFKQTEEIPSKMLPPDLMALDFKQPYVRLADMTGDGLLDIVHIDTLTGEVHYWPNLGYGKFGKRVTMRNKLGKVFSQSDIQHMFLLDVDGSGPADLVYVANNKIDVWINCSGKEWRRIAIEGTPLRVHPVVPVDLFGNKINGILWSGGGGFSSYEYLPLSKTKPGLLTGINNNMGRRIRYHYTSSTQLALNQSKAGQNWVGRLPFPVYVLHRVERYDDIGGSKLVSEFKYAHGHYDDKEKEFVGFGRVKQTDTEFFNPKTPYKSGKDSIKRDLHQPPVQTIWWFHTGVDVEQGVASHHLAHEYFPCKLRAYKSQAATLQLCKPQQHTLPDSVLSPEARSQKPDALRALKGQLLRKEIYALDNSKEAAIPYETVEYNYRIRLLQKAKSNFPAIFHAYQDQVLDCYYERDANDPRVRHQFTLEVDEFGNAIESVSVAYPRRAVSEHAEQKLPLTTCTTRCFAQRTDAPHGYRHSVLAEERTFEITGLQVLPNSLIEINSLRNQCRSAQEIHYEESPKTDMLCKRLISKTRHYFWDDDAQTPMPLCKTGLLALPRNTYEMALTPGLRMNVYGGRLSNDILSQEGGYAFEDGTWWVPTGNPNTGHLQFDPQQFYLTTRLIDPFGAVSHITYDEYRLLATEVRDPVGNVTRAKIDYRTVKPTEIQDFNGNRATVALDALGLVVGTAVMGKLEQNKGDSLREFVVHLSRERIRHHIEKPLDSAHELLMNATTRTVYDLWSLYETKREFSKDGPFFGTDREFSAMIPPVVHTFRREMHVADLRSGDNWRIQQSFVYFDGFGRQIQMKVQAAPGLAPVRDSRGVLKRNPDLSLVLEHLEQRWVGTGRTVYDNKGNPIKKYEPFFSSTFRLEPETDLVDCGVTSVFRYDPLGRLVRTDYPDGSVARTTFDAWEIKFWDRNDTVLDHESKWLSNYMKSGDGAKRRAAELTRKHANTHAIDHLDVFGRRFLHVDDNGDRGKYLTHTKLDIQGNVLQVTDARKNPAIVSEYDMRGGVLRTRSVDSGERLIFENVAGNGIRSWDGAGHKIRRLYDKLQRSTHVFVQLGAEKELLVEFRIYGEQAPDPERTNLRGRLFQEYDEAGLVENTEYDFKGNLIRTRRTFVRDISMNDWANLKAGTQAGLLDPDESFDKVCQYDALNRPFRAIYPDRSVIERFYDERGLINHLRVQLSGSGPSETYVENIEYNAKKQRTKIVCGNAVQTSLSYDPYTFRLERVNTTRLGAKPLLQDLRYTYDAVGNLIEVVDGAQPTIFVSNEQIEARWQYEYNALYRLKQAKGREHQSLSNSQARDHQDLPFLTVAHPNDVQAMRNYNEEYDYDAVGNILSVKHRAGQASWTRLYQYHDSSNRLKSTAAPSSSTGDAIPITYNHDANGNITQMPHLSQMAWDHADRLVRISKGKANNGNAQYAYDTASNRTRTAVRRGNIVDERLYVDGYEVFRRRQNGATSTERRTLHVMLEDGSRIAMIEWTSLRNAKLSRSQF